MFCQEKICMNEYFAPNSFPAKRDNFVFPWSLAWTIDEVENPCCLSFHGDFLGVWRSNFLVFRSMWHSPTREQRGEITALYLVTLDIEILGILDKSINLLIFYKPIQVSYGAMRLCMFLSTVNVLLGQSAYIIIRLSAHHFLGSVIEADAPSVCFLQRLTWSASTHSCFVLQGVSWHLWY